MRLVPLSLLLAVACGPALQSGPSPVDGTSEVASVASSLSGRATPLVDTLASVMGPSSGTTTGGSTVTPCEDVPDDVSVDGTAYLVSPPLMRQGGGWTRLPQVLRLDEDGCGVLATLDADDAERMRTGVAKRRDDGSLAFDGLMLRLVEVDDALWLFSNTTDQGWAVDTDDGSVTELELPGHVGGAISDGDGGAWLAVLARHDQRGTALDDHHLVHIDEDLVELDTIDLPFSPVLGAIGLHRDGDLVAGLQSLDLVSDGDDLYVLHSQAAELAEVDTAFGLSATVDLDVPNPTGLARFGDDILVVSGALTDADGATLTDPALHTVDPSDGSLSEVTVLPEPTDGWGHWILDARPDGDRISRNVWFDAVQLGDALLIADPSHDRALLVE